MSEWARMRLLLASEVTPLLGSLGLHGCAVLALFVAVRTPASVALARERADPWTGSAVEVDAVTTPQEAAASSDSVPAGAKSEPAHSDPVAVAPAVVPDPVRRPRPARVATPIHQSASDSAQKSGAESVSAAGQAADAFGSDGLPPGVRSLPRAFTRAIPPATSADPIWQTLAIGVQKPFTMAIEVGADGHISSAEILKEKDGNAAEPEATHLRERMVSLLGAGLFALEDNGGAGRELFRITVTLSDRAARDADAPAELVERGFDPPHGSAPGRAYFTLASGRHFEAKVQVLNAPSRR